MTTSSDLATLKELSAWSLHDERADALGELGLFLHQRLEPQGYWCSPANAYAFGSTGGDGVTFSLVDAGVGLREDSPVVMTVPMADGRGHRPNWIVGQDLREFLALGLDTSYFVLEELAYDEHFPERIAASRGQVRHPLLQDLAQHFTLTSWTEIPDRLARLEATFMPLLDLPPSS